MNMHNPAHPGEILEGWITDLDMTITQFAGHIGISRVMLSRIIHGHASLTADMDLRLDEALGTTPGYWLRMQHNRDIWEAQQKAGSRPAVARLAA